MVAISMCMQYKNIESLQICKAIFSTHYSIFQPNFGILLFLKVLNGNFLFFAWICPDQKLVYYENRPIVQYPNVSC